MEIQGSRSNSPAGKDTGKRNREKTSSSPEGGSTERTRAQELEAMHKRFSSNLDQEIYRDLSKYDNFLNKEEIQEIKDAIETAKQGLELFKNSYENGSETWKKILILTCLLL